MSLTLPIRMVRRLSPIQAGKTGKSKCWIEMVPGPLPNTCSQGSEERGQQLQMSAFIINKGAVPDSQKHINRHKAETDGETETGTENPEVFMSGPTATQGPLHFGPFVPDSPLAQVSPLPGQTVAGGTGPGYTVGLVWGKQGLQRSGGPSPPGPRGFSLTETITF